MSFEQDQSEKLQHDMALLARIEHGDQSALAELYDRHSRLVYSVALRVCVSASDAEDVLQEVFFQIWQKPQQFVPARGSLAVWLGVVARNRSIDLIRTRHVTQNVDDLPLASKDDFGAVLQDHDTMNKVRILVQTLPLEQRKLLDLAYFGGKTHQEIAIETGYPLGTIKTRIRTALSSLRKKLNAGSHHPSPPSTPNQIRPASLKKSAIN